MTFSTLMVHLDGDRANGAVLDAAATLATLYRARVIGIAACQPLQLGDCDGYMDGAFAVVERDIVADELARANLEFHAHAGLRSHDLEWRSIPTMENVAHVVAAQARCADMIITGVGPVPGDSASHADTGDLVLTAGRPVLVVPAGNRAFDFRTILVAWADTRECRRAVTDALPMLHRADRVVVAGVSADPVRTGGGVSDVVAWLRRHRIDADRIVAREQGSCTDTLASIAADQDADIVVAGAYGHTRIREWAFGGVTRDLLLQGPHCTLLSH